MVFLLRTLGPISPPTPLTLRDEFLACDVPQLKYLCHDLGTGMEGVRHVGVSQNYGYHFGVPIIRTIVFWDRYWGTLILGNYHVLVHKAAFFLPKDIVEMAEALQARTWSTCNHESSYHSDCSNAAGVPTKPKFASGTREDIYTCSPQNPPIFMSIPKPEP